MPKQQLWGAKAAAVGGQSSSCGGPELVLLGGLKSGAAARGFWECLPAAGMLVCALTHARARVCVGVSVLLDERSNASVVVRFVAAGLQRRCMATMQALLQPPAHAWCLCQSPAALVQGVSLAVVLAQAAQWVPELHKMFGCDCLQQRMSMQNVVCQVHVCLAVLGFTIDAPAVTS